MVTLDTLPVWRKKTLVGNYVLGQNQSWLTAELSVAVMIQRTVAF